MERKNKNEANLSDLTKRFLEEVERMGVSFYNIAKSTGVKEAMFTKIKRGIQEPSKKFLSKFAECFPDANMKYIYLGNEKNNAEHDINNEAFNDYTYRFLETIEKLELTDYKVWNTLENLSKATMSKIRRGICGVSMNTLQEFCQTYQVNAKRITARDYRNVTPFFLLSAYYVIINDLYEQTRFYICFILVHYISLYFMKCATNVIPLCDTKSFKL